MPLWVRGLTITLLTLFLANLAGISDGLNRWLTDQHWRWRATMAPGRFPSRVLLIAIDDASILNYGQRLGNWRRERMARLIRKLKQADAVGLDIVYSERDDRYPEDDAAMAAAMKENGRVVLAYNQWKDPRPLNQTGIRQIEQLKQHLPPVPPAVADGGLAPLIDAMLQPPIAAFMDAAAALGSVSVDSDGDGVHRAVRMVRSTTDGRALVSFALAVAATAEGEVAADVLGGLPGQIKLGGRAIPLQGAAMLLQPIGRSGSGTRHGQGMPVPTMSFRQALENEPAETFRGKIILVGETATGTTDIRPTPLDPGLRGVELNMEVLSNLLSATPAQPLGLPAQWGLVLIALAAPLLLYSRLGPARATQSAVVVLVTLVAALEVLFWMGRVVPLWAPILLPFFGGTLSMGLMRLQREETQKRRLRESFSRYAPPALVEQLVHDPERARQEGTRQRVAVLFSDIRSFTSYSEQNPPEVVVRQMREYLDEMTASVDRFRGVLDKFIGDAVMALFGPFIEGQVNTSSLAVASALDMLQRLETLNERWATEGLPTFRIGIGIHVGEAIVGNIGTARREQFTALGDTVNLSARLQTATKDLQCVLLVSEDTKNEAEPLVRNMAEFIDRGTLSIRGREQAVRVFEVRARPTARTEMSEDEQA